MKKLLVSLLALALVLSLSGAAFAETEVKFGATPSPHSEILAVIQPLMKEKGFNMNIQVFTDYVVPNEATESGDLDANYFQHLPYMEEFNAGRGTHLNAVIPMHFEPMAVYPGQSASLAEIKEGAIIAVPNDPTNEARALLLLEAQGLIKIAPDKGLSATKLDVIENPHKIEFFEVDAAQVARSLADVDFAVINGNYALEAGLSAAKDGVAAEALDSEAAKKYINYVVVKLGNENAEWIAAFKDVLKDEKVLTFVNEKYQGAVIPAFDAEVPPPSITAEPVATEAPSAAPAADTAAPAAAS